MLWCDIGLLVAMRCWPHPFDKAHGKANLTFQCKSLYKCVWSMICLLLCPQKPAPGLLHSRFLDKYLLINDWKNFPKLFSSLLSGGFFSSQYHFCLHESLVKICGKMNCMVSIEVYFLLLPSHLISSATWGQHNWNLLVVLNTEHLKLCKSLHF